MKLEGIRIGNWPWVVLMASSAVAVVFLNALAFGLSGETVYDSLVHTAFIASCVSVFVVSAAPVIEKFRFPIRVVAIIIGIVPATFVGVFLATQFLYFVNLFDEPYKTMPSGRTLVFSLIISYIFGLGGYLYLSSRGKLKLARVVIREKAEAEQKARALASEAKFASLESRIRPHFLFNTLNSIAALIREDPKTAERMIEQLSNVLRYSLDESAEHFNTLEQEVAITRDYLEIQKARFADKLDYRFDIGEGLKNRRVPTFAIHTLVENSIKHAAVKGPGQTFVQISALSRNGNTILNVKDNGEGFSRRDIRSGHGLDNLAERIDLIYGGRATIEIESESGASVSVIIPTDE